MAAKPERTLADFAAIAIGPILIMFLVGSLCFFLLEVAWSGQASGATRWVLAWFVVGIVLIARLSIELGSAQALGYGACLAAATAFVLMSPVGCLLLAAAWWCAHKLTWDCTVVDDRADASGEGLLDAAGVPLDDSPAPAPSMSSNADETKTPGKAKTAIDRFVDWMNSEDKRPHAPGVWVLYFSLAALPLFGIGELFIPRGAGAVRTAAFQDLFLYTASALALLVTTSFLGLQRYLRQRKIEMPTEIAATWIGGGAAVVIAVLVACLVIPRPYSETSVTAWLEKQAQAPAGEASDYAVTEGQSGEGTGREIGQGDKPQDQSGDSSGSSKSDANSQQGATSQQNNQQSGTGKSSSEQQNSGGQSKGSDDKSNSGSSSNQNKQPNSQNNGPSSQTQNSSDTQNSQQQNTQQTPGEKTSQGEANQQQTGEKESSINSGDSSQSQQQTPPPDQAQATPKQSSRTPDFFGAIGRFIAFVVKWLIYGAIALGVLYVLWNYGSDILESLGQLWRDLWAWWYGLTGQPAKTKRSEEAEPLVMGPTHVPFSAFRDPFLTGEANRFDTPRLLAYTFEAAQAWAREQGLPERSDRTPLEFAQEAARQFPDAAGELPGVAQIYAAMLYGSRTPPDAVRGVLERLWGRMSMRQPAGMV